MRRRWGTLQGFFLAFTDDPEKQLIFIKKLLKWTNKKQNNFNIYHIALKSKIKKNTGRYHYFTAVYQKSL